MTDLFSGGERRDFACNTEAERCLLARLLLGQTALETVTGLVSSRDFYYDEHRRVFDAISALCEKEELVDIITVQEELRRRDVDSRVARSEFLVGLFDAFSPTEDAAHCARTIRLCALWRGQGPPAS